MRLVVVIPSRQHVLPSLVEKVGAWQVLNMAVTKGHVPSTTVALPCFPDRNLSVIACIEKVITRAKVILGVSERV